MIHPELSHPRGAEKQVCKLCYFLDKMGHDITFYTFEKENNYVFDYLLIFLCSNFILYFPLFFLH